MTQLRVLQSAREFSAIDPELLRSGRGEDCEEEANRDRGVFQHGIITQKPELPQRAERVLKIVSRRALTLRVPNQGGGAGSRRADSRADHTAMV